MIEVATSVFLISSVMTLTTLLGVAAWSWSTVPDVRGLVESWYREVGTDYRTTLHGFYSDPVEDIVSTLYRLADPDDLRWGVLKMMLDGDTAEIRAAFQESAGYGALRLFQIIEDADLWPKFHAMLYRPALFRRFITRLEDEPGMCYPSLDGISIIELAHQYISSTARLRVVRRTGATLYNTWASDAVCSLLGLWPDDDIRYSLDSIADRFQVRTPAVVSDDRGDSIVFEDIIVRDESGGRVSVRLVGTPDELTPGSSYTIQIMDDIGVFDEIDIDDANVSIETGSDGLTYVVLSGDQDTTMLAA